MSLQAPRRPILLLTFTRLGIAAISLVVLPGTAPAGVLPCGPAPATESELETRGCKKSELGGLTTYDCETPTFRVSAYGADNDWTLTLATTTSGTLETIIATTSVLQRRLINVLRQQRLAHIVTDYVAVRTGARAGPLKEGLIRWLDGYSFPSNPELVSLPHGWAEKKSAEESVPDSPGWTVSYQRTVLRKGETTLAIFLASRKPASRSGQTKRRPEAIATLGLRPDKSMKSLSSEYARASRRMEELTAKYPRVLIVGRIEDKLDGGAILVMGVAQGCRPNIDSGCPNPYAGPHNLLVLDPDAVALERSLGIQYAGSHPYLRRSSGRNAFGVSVPVFVYGDPDDLRAAKAEVQRLRKLVSSHGIDPETGMSIEARLALDERRAEEARGAKLASAAKIEAEMASAPRQKLHGVLLNCAGEESRQSAAVPSNPKWEGKLLIVTGVSDRDKAVRKLDAELRLNGGDNPPEFLFRYEPARIKNRLPGRPSVSPRPPCSNLCGIFAFCEVEGTFFEHEGVQYIETIDED